MGAASSRQPHRKLTLVLLLAMGLQMWTLNWMEAFLSMVLQRVEDNTQLLLGLAAHPERDEEGP